MKKLIEKAGNFLRQPYGEEPHPIQTILIATFLVIFVLAVFQPFGIADSSRKEYAIILLITAISNVGGILIMIYLLPVIFKQFFNPENQTIGKVILINMMTVLIIAVSNGLAHGLYRYLSDASLSAYFWHIFGVLFVATFLVSPIPVIVLTIINYNRMLASNLKQAQALNVQLLKRVVKEPSITEKPTLVLSGATKESIELLPENLLYIEAFGNYVKVYYLEANGNLQQKMLRSTIKQVEDALSEYPFIIRCHRAFLVNTQAITSINGNSQGYRLTLQHTNDEVPVSRAYTKALKEQIEG